KIAATVGPLHATLDANMHRLAASDISSLKNACLWLSLFEGDRHGFFAGMVTKLKPHVSAKTFVLSHFEQMTVEYLLARQRGEDSEASDYLALLKAHPLWQDPNI